MERHFSSYIMLIQAQKEQKPKNMTHRMELCLLFSAALEEKHWMMITLETDVHQQAHEKKNDEMNVLHLLRWQKMQKGKYPREI